MACRSRAGELEIVAVTEMSRREDKEHRLRLYELLQGEAYCAVLTWRDKMPSAISLCKTNRMERKRHGLQGDD